MNRKTIVESLLAGVAISLLTGLIPNTPPTLVGATWYGYPLVWLFEMVVAPQYYPWSIIFVNLLIDIIFWAIIIGVSAFLFGKLRKQN